MVRSRFFSLLATFTAAWSIGCGDAGGGLGDAGGDGTDSGGECGEKQEGEACEPDSCGCDPDIQALNCLFEDGKAATGDYVCVDTTPDGEAKVGEPCIWSWDCETDFCYQASEDDPLSCQADCLEQGEQLYGDSSASGCCAGYASCSVDSCICG